MPLHWPKCHPTQSIHHLHHSKRPVAIVERQRATLDSLKIVGSQVQKTMFLPYLALHAALQPLQLRPRQIAGTHWAGESSTSPVRLRPQAWSNHRVKPKPRCGCFRVPSGHGAHSTGSKNLCGRHSRLGHAGCRPNQAKAAGQRHFGKTPGQPKWASRCWRNPAQI